jgi:competence ComEA-like helix-hairpin-helix protein
MRKSFSLLVLTTSLVTSACAKRDRQYRSLTDEAPTAVTQAAPRRININTASANELEVLPGIGKALAARIVEHREEFGRFRRPEHLIMVRGISDKRFRNLQNLVTVE